MKIQYWCGTLLHETESAVYPLADVFCIGGRLFDTECIYYWPEQDLTEIHVTPKVTHED